MRTKQACNTQNEGLEAQNRDLTAIIHDDFDLDKGAE